MDDDDATRDDSGKSAESVGREAKRKDKSLGSTCPGLDTFLKRSLRG